jgi:hypothetical protein
MTDIPLQRVWAKLDTDARADTWYSADGGRTWRRERVYGDDTQVEGSRLTVLMELEDGK